MKHLILVTFVIFSLCAFTANAQRFEYGLDFKVRFDNREYKSELASDKTLFGLKLTPEIGVSWGDHRLMGGVDLTRHFGAKEINQPDPELVLYYHFENHRNFTAYAGIFRRTAMSGGYPRAFFTSTTVFYDPLIEGMLLRYYGRKGSLELACDWNGMITDTDREKFVIYSRGDLRLCNIRLLGYGSNLRIGYSAMMHHFAGTHQNRSVVDNALIYPEIKFAFSLRPLIRSRSDKAGEPIMVGDTRFTNSFLSIGWLQAIQNDRDNEGEFVRPGGFTADVQLVMAPFGVRNTLYLGDDLMPYYDRYGSELYMGDTFFRTEEGIYNRLEVFWQPRLSDGVSLRVSTIHHYEGKRWNWQQLVTFSVRLDRKKFEK